MIAMTFTAVKSSIRRLDANVDDYLEVQQLEDFYFSMGALDVNVLPGSATLELCDQLDIYNDCLYDISFVDDPVHVNHLNTIINDAINDNPLLYESIVDSYADEFASEYNLTIEKSFVVDIIEGEYNYKFVSVTEDINVPYIVSGRIPEDHNEIAIFPEFAELNDLSIGDEYIIDGKAFTIVGTFYKPEFLFPIFSLTTVTYEPEYQTLVLGTKETIRDLNEYIFNKYLVIGDLDQILPDYGYSSIQSNDYSMLGKGMQMIYFLMPADINFRIIALQTEITNANAFINAFLPVFTTLIVLLLLLFMKKYIDQNKADIKTLHAIGYSDKELSLALLTQPFFIGLFGMIGYLIGLLVSNQFFDLYSARYLYPKAGFQFDIDLFVIAGILPLLAIILMNYLFIRVSLRDKLHVFKAPWIRLHKFVTTKTLLFTASLIFIVSVLIGFGLNGNSMFNSFIDYTKKGNHYAEMISLQNMTNTDHFDTYETYTKSPAKIIQVNSRTLKTVQSTIVYGISPTTTLKRLINDEISSNQLVNEGVVISDFLHTSLGLDIGDTITYTIGEVEVEETVVGVSNELLENNFYTSQTKLNSYFSLDDTYYNGLYTTDYNYDSPRVLSRIDYNNSLEEFSAILNVSSLIINYLVVLSVILSIFIFSLVMINYFTSHRLDIAILRSIGYSNNELHIKYLVPLFILLVLFYIISIPITDWMINYLLTMLMDSIGFKLIVEITVVNIIVGFTILCMLFGIFIMYINKYYNSLHISSILKHSTK